MSCVGPALQRASALLERARRARCQLHRLVQFSMSADKAGQFGGQSGELCSELLDLLMLLLAMLEQFKKSSPTADRCGGPVRF
jgi:hypothetical protein